MQVKLHKNGTSLKNKRGFEKGWSGRQGSQADQQEPRPWILQQLVGEGVAACVHTISMFLSGASSKTELKVYRYKSEYQQASFFSLPFRYSISPPASRKYSLGRVRGWGRACHNVASQPQQYKILWRHDVEVPIPPAFPASSVNLCSPPEVQLRSKKI